MDRSDRSSWLPGPGLGWWDVAAAAVLTAVAILSVLGVTDRHDHGDAGAALAVVLMTAPIVWARRTPVVVAGLLAAGAGLNWGAYDHLVRCGAALPAVFYTAFMLGSRCARRWPLAAGGGLLVVALLCQSYSDPRLTGPGVLGLMVPISAAFWAAGRLLRGRNLAVARLQGRTAELRAQREENARLAVAADQARIAGDLDGYLRRQVDTMAAAADAGRLVVAEDPDGAAASFAAIGDTGRATLGRMRTVVADLKEPAPTGPQPMLAQLDHLLGAFESDARLSVRGDPRILPPGIELAAYRIVEHLLATLERDRAVPVEVSVRFGPGSLELTVAGAPGRQADRRRTLAAVRERVVAFGGTLQADGATGRSETVVRLPLASAAG